VALAVVLAASVSVAAPGDPGRKFGKSDPGAGISLAEGDAKEPRGLFLRVRGTAGLTVSVTTVTGCTRQGARPRGGDGAFNEVAPFTRRLRQPLKKADRCRVSVVATYEQGSEDWIKAQLFARRAKG
jgi:hypothetical protein